MRPVRFFGVPQRFRAEHHHAIWNWLRENSNRYLSIPLMSPMETTANAVLTTTPVSLALRFVTLAVERTHLQTVVRPAGWRDFDALAEWDDEHARKEFSHAR